MIVLGIETSCDDTGIGVYDSNKGLLANKMISQLSTHQPYGGVVPELASRDHQKNIIFLIHDVLLGINLEINDIDLVAYTAGPGLIGALLVGAGVAYSIAQALNVPIIGVHHHLAHIEVAFLNEETINYPYLGLLVSGGHTYILHVKDINQCEILGSTIDDAVGEAIDKSARVMGLGYPGGPIVEKRAAQVSQDLVNFPRPMLHNKTMQMSFSGLKTAVVNEWNKHVHTTDEICKSLMHAIRDVLLKKLSIAFEEYDYKHLVVAGGVAANLFLRSAFSELAQQNGAQLICPDIKLCTDNGAMIAFLGYRLYHMKKGLDFPFVNPSWSLKEFIR